MEEEIVEAFAGDNAKAGARIAEGSRRKPSSVHFLVKGEELDDEGDAAKFAGKWPYGEASRDFLVHLSCWLGADDDRTDFHMSLDLHLCHFDSNEEERRFLAGVSVEFVFVRPRPCMWRRRRRILSRTEK